MIDGHSRLLQDLAEVNNFKRSVDEHSTRADQSAGDGIEPHDLLQHVSVAVEDIPEDLREAVRDVLMRPDEDTSLRDRVVDVVENAAGAGWGDIENVTKRVALLHLLSRISFTKPYTYRIEARVIRGSRPTSAKLKQLYAGGCRATVNLCAEMVGGDTELLHRAGITDMAAHHIPILDNHPPTEDQVRAFLSAVTATSEGSLYVHCEAGVGRTSVMVACYRMAHGWSVENALLEAKQFGCNLPGQQADIGNLAKVFAADNGQVPQPDPTTLAETLAANADQHGLARALSSQLIAGAF